MRISKGDDASPNFGICDTTLIKNYSYPKLILDQLRQSTDSLNILYYPQEYIPLYHKSSTMVSVDYLLGQLLSIELNDSMPLNYSSYVSFSLKQIYLNTSNILQEYFSKILLNRIGTNHYSHRFSFQMNTTKLARNISLIFFDLPNSQKYLFTIDIAYNNSCLKSTRIDEKSLKYTIYIDLWQDNYFVYSIPIEPMSIVCAQIEIITKDVQIRNLKRTGKFLVIETGCYTFGTNIYQDYYSKVPIITVKYRNYFLGRKMLVVRMNSFDSLSS
jgi:hypothetical protein